MAQTDCGCCAGIETQTPARMDNRPGLSAIAYRVGVHASFKASMLARLSQALTDLNTRDNRDFTIALLDAWATVADILTFYQERIANESYLRSATERRSLLELARLIGYELRPGVSANVYLAFTLESEAAEITISAATQAQHVPAGEELPQKFETSRDVLARPAWNEIRAQQTERHPYSQQNGLLRADFFFAGVATNLRAGDLLLITPDDTPDNSDSAAVLRAVGGVEPQPKEQRTAVRVTNPTIVANTIVATSVLAIGAVSAATQTYYGQTVNATYLNILGLYQNFLAANVYQNLVATRPLPPGILVFRSQASAFGHNAPKWETLPGNLRVGEVVPTGKTKTKFVAGPFKQKSQWVDSQSLKTARPSASTGVANEYFLHLDTTYAVSANSTVVIQSGRKWLHGEVLEATEVSLAEFTISAKVTRLRVRFKSGANLAQFPIRTTSVYLRSESLNLARLPITTPVQGHQIRLEGWVDGLVAGQDVMLCGELYDDLGNYACEHTVIAQVEQSIAHEGGTVVTLKADAAHRYVRTSFSMNANVALATHGERKITALGSGDGSVPFQQFLLPDKPLTHTSSRHPSGAEPALQLRINGVQWHGVDNLAQSLPGDRHYQLRQDDDNATTVHFGDGYQGARLPTGMENVRATYRLGTGRAGNVPADAIRLLARRPLGVRQVINPLPATGGADPESRDDARVNAPLTTLTLDRIVSLQDYEDYARAFAGISKALATWTWFGQERGVFLTVAGADGADVAEPIYSHLLAAIRAASDPSIPVRMGKAPSYQQRFFQIAGSLTVHPDYEQETVLLAAAQSLRCRFSFALRSFGQDVTLSEAIATLQPLPGVVAVDIDALHLFGQPSQLQSRLRAKVPRSGSRRGNDLEPAELLLVSPNSIHLEAT